MGDDLDYERIGGCTGVVLAGAVFLGSWIYCIAAYGFLLGVGLGWLPSAIIAGLAYLVGRYLWPLLILAALGVAWLIVKGSQGQ